MANRYLRRAAALSAGQVGRPDATPIYLNSSTSTLKYVPASSGSTEVEIVDVSTAQTLTNKTINGATGVTNLVTYSGDAAITLVSQVALLTKGSAAAMTVAAPGAAGVGARITITAGSNFAHVITFTGGTLGDGTTGLNTTVTMTAFIGSSITVIGNTATQWVVESQNVLTSIA